MAKPPKQPQFNKDGSVSKRGQSEGSRSTQFAGRDGRVRPGRTKGSRDEKSIVLAIRDQPVTLVLERDEDGRPIKIKRVTTREAILAKQREKSLKGDQKATEFLDRKFGAHEPISVEPDLTRALLEEDLAILADARARGLLPPPSSEAEAPPTAVPPSSDTKEGEE